MMYRQWWIIFFAAKDGQQIFHVCPMAVKGFWDTFFETQPSDEQNNNYLIAWIDTVPPVLRSKIQVYTGNYVPFNDLILKNVEAMDALHAAFIQNKRESFEPLTMAQTIAQSIIAGNRSKA